MIVLLAFLRSKITTGSLFDSDSSQSKSADGEKPSNIRRWDWSCCLCHCSGTSSTTLTAFSEVNWARLKEAASVRKDETWEFVGSLWDDGPRGFYHQECYKARSSQCPQADREVEGCN